MSEVLVLNQALLIDHRLAKPRFLSRDEPLRLFLGRHLFFEKLLVVVLSSLCVFTIEHQDLVDSRFIEFGNFFLSSVIFILGGTMWNEVLLVVVVEDVLLLLIRSSQPVMIAFVLYALAAQVLRQALH